MEDKTYYGNQPEEIDAAYIDQLLSAPTVPRRDPAPQPEPESQPEPVASAPVKPAIKTFPKPLFILIAIALLGVGFLFGWLARGNRQVPADASTATTLPASTENEPGIVPTTDPGIAVDYAAMSTTQLTDIAIQIPELEAFGSPTVSAGLNPNIYASLKEKYPVLTELEQRPDAVEQLTFYNLVSSSLYGNPAATALIEYYVAHLGFDPYPPETSVILDYEWVCQTDGQFTVYEYTASPEVYYIMDETEGTDITTVTTVFNFGDYEIFLRGDPNWSEGAANFWYRVEYTQEDFSVSSVPDPEPELTWSSATSSSWVTWQRCDDGWFLYGYAASEMDLTFAVYPSRIEKVIHLTVTPIPQTVTDPSVLAQTVFDRAETLLDISSLNPEKDLANYPLVAALLEQSDGISALLNLTQKNLPSMFSSTIDFSFSHTLQLLALPAFQSRMRSAEQLAYQALAVGGYDYISCENLSEPAIAETPDGFALTFIQGYLVGTPSPEQLPVPLSEMNFWAYIHLSDGAKILCQDTWFLNARFEQESCPVIFWPVYNSLTGQMDGWILCGKSEERISLQLDLMQTQSIFLQSYQLDPRFLGP